MLRRLDRPRRFWIEERGQVVRACTAELSVSTAHLDALGPPHWEDAFIDWTEALPPSPERGWGFVAECGLEFSVHQEWYRPDGCVDHAVLTVSTEDEVGHALLHLPFSAVVRWRSAAVIHGGWRVRRVDDAGVEHAVGLYPFESSARRVAATLEGRGHKQGYFVEAHGEPPRVVVRGA